MATDRIINQTQGDEIITALTAIKNAINNQPVPTGVEDTVAAAFDSGTSYAVGDFCIYNGMLYKCTTAHHGNWDGSDFTLTTMGAQVTSLNQALIKFEDVTSLFAPQVAMFYFSAKKIDNMVFIQGRVSGTITNATAVLKLNDAKVRPNISANREYGCFGSSGTTVPTAMILDISTWNMKAVNASASNMPNLDFTFWYFLD